MYSTAIIPLKKFNEEILILLRFYQLRNIFDRRAVKQ